MARFFYLLCVVSLVSGCIGTPVYLEPDVIWPIVADVYSERVADVTPECAAWLEATRVMPTGVPIPGTETVLSDMCKNAAGCHIVAGGRSAIWCRDTGWADDVNICYGHEFLHALGYCMTGLRDNEHTQAALWCNHGYLCRDMRKASTSSVEFGVNEVIWAMY